MLKIVESGPAISLDDLEQFQLRFGLVLPREYQEFLLSTNGGTPVPNWFDSAGVSFHVRKFFPFDETDPYGLQKQAELFLPDFNNGVLPIASDYGGNRICLRVAGSRVGEVGFWRHETALEIEPAAATFSALLQGLHFEPEMLVEVQAIDELAERGTPEEVLRFWAAGHAIDETNAHGRSLLQEAAVNGNLSVAKLCVDRGANPAGAIQLAAMNSQRELIDYLLECGVDINERDARGRTALSYARTDRELSEYIRQRGGLL